MKKKIDFQKLGNNWISGTYKGFTFNAKVYSEPSVFGINGGPVSKLLVTKKIQGEEKWIFNYDRGADVENPIGYEIARVIELAQEKGEL